jgi:uncharacterized protein (DUF427 family)
MSKSPGHQKWPDHQVREEPLRQPMEVEVEGVVVASSADVIKVVEDKSPVRYYFPRTDVRTDKLKRSQTASYYSLNVGERQLDDAIWSYEDPYDEHQALKGRMAFYDDRLPEIHVRPKS